MDFPILPFIERAQDGSVRFFKRNPRLFAPKDFDYSPYFSIIKYPYLGINDIGLYHRLPWSDEDIYNDERHAFNPPPSKVLQREQPVTHDDAGDEPVAEASTITTVGHKRLGFAFLRRGE